MKRLTKFLFASVASVGAMAWLPANVTAHRDAPAVAQEQVASPYYESWSATGEGTKVTYDSSITVDGEAHSATLIWTLKTLTTVHAVVTETRIRDGKPADDSETTYEAQVAADKKWDVGGLGISPKPDGEEDVADAAGKIYRCTRLKIDEKTGGETMTGTIFYSKDVPGGVVKMTLKGSNGTTTMEGAMILKSIEAKPKA